MSEPQKIQAGEAQIEGVIETFDPATGIRQSYPFIGKEVVVQPAGEVQDANPRDAGS